MANYTFVHLPLLLHLLLLVLLFPCDQFQKRCPWGSQAVNHEEPDNHVVKMTPATTCKDTAKGRGLTLAHRQGPCSPLAANRRPRDSRIIFLRDQLRVRSINTLGQSRVQPSGNNSEKARLPIRSGSPLGGDFVVTIGLGTPKVDLTLIFDTGSDVTWIKCAPCPGCHPQKDPSFEPSKSTTYSPCSGSNCSFTIKYEDRSHSDGYYIRDLLTLTPEYKFPNFIFGCSQHNSGDFGDTAGMLALGQGDNTLISQTASEFSEIFCYCIPGSESSNGYLLFGLEALSNCQTDNYTPLISDGSTSSPYFVNLVGIAFGKQNFSFSSQSQQSQPPRTIIDSGTTITRLPPSIYSAVREEFVKHMSNYPIAPPQTKLLNTCYDLQHQTKVNMPKMVLQFENTEVRLDPSAIVSLESNAVVCLAFAPKSGHVIIGSVQQQNLNILYNIKAKKVEFGNGACGN